MGLSQGCLASLPNPLIGKTLKQWTLQHQVYRINCPLLCGAVLVEQGAGTRSTPRAMLSTTVHVGCASSRPAIGPTPGSPTETAAQLSHISISAMLC